MDAEAGLRMGDLTPLIEGPVKFREGKKVSTPSCLGINKDLMCCCCLLFSVEVEVRQRDKTLASGR